MISEKMSKSLPWRKFQDRWLHTSHRIELIPNSNSLVSENARFLRQERASRTEFKICYADPNFISVIDGKKSSVKANLTTQMSMEETGISSR